MINVYAISLEDNNRDYKKANEKYATACGDIYLHGKLEEINGYDICLLNEVPGKDGVYDCTVFMGERGCEAKLFYWTVPYVDRKRHRGLVVLDNDSEGKTFAKKKLREKAEFL